MASPSVTHQHNVHSTHTHTHFAGVPQLTLEALYTWSSQGHGWFIWKLQRVLLHVPAVIVVCPPAGVCSWSGVLDVTRIDKASCKVCVACNLHHCYL